MLLAAQPLASQPNSHRRLYVEPFATQEGAETLQAVHDLLLISIDLSNFRLTRSQ
jgi:hypothetical protein